MLVVAIATQVPYSASKGGINQLTSVMSLGLAAYGIRVNAIGPGSIMTDMLTTVNADPQARHRLLSRTPLGRFGEAAEDRLDRSLPRLRRCKLHHWPDHLCRWWPFAAQLYGAGKTLICTARPHDPPAVSRKSAWPEKW